VIAAFFEAVAPAELEAWEQTETARQQAAAALDRAEAQQVERLRYQAALAQRQFNRVDPDNRLVAAELERRWELPCAICGKPKKPCPDAGMRWLSRPL
jgi:hypothetical protein